MTSNLSFDGGSPFRIKRPLITTSGFVSDVDPTIKGHLDELNALLGKRIFAQRRSVASGTKKVASKGDKEDGALAGSPEISVIVPDIPALLARPLTPKHTPDMEWETRHISWVPDSLVFAFHEANEAPENLSLSDYIDMTAELSSLKYAFQSNLSANWFNLDYNIKTILDAYPAITDYLVAFAYHLMSLTDVNGIKNFILSNRLGAKNVADYAIVSAARTIVEKEQLKVPHYNTDSSPIVSDIKSAGLSLSSASFQTSVQALINDHIFNAKEAKLIDESGIGPIPANIKPLLIKYIRASTVPITKDNVKFFLPLFISQIGGTTPVEIPTEVDTEQSDKDFDVEFLQDDNSLIQISKSAVKCSSQLYYSMILGDELDVFHITNYFTHKYLIRGGIEIQDSRLRDDLQTYVFSNRFTDLKTQKLVDRTRPAERHMFYRQVFNYGNGQVTEDVIVNREFPKLWKVLILESAKYLERAQASFNPDSYVSRQNVMQAVEDLQYNLSTHCTGMANVITPMIYAELNFVVQRIFMNPEILRQVVPAGGTWWRVVETLYLGMKNVRPKATVLYNKAKLGHDIIRSIADYNPATFEDDANFSAFISNVDAFITTQSILQEALTDDLKKGDDEEGDYASAARPSAPVTMPNIPNIPNMPPAGVPVAAGSKGGDEWDF